MGIGAGTPPISPGTEDFISQRSKIGFKYGRERFSAESRPARLWNRDSPTSDYRVRISPPRGNFAKWTVELERKKGEVEGDENGSRSPSPAASSIPSLDTLELVLENPENFAKPQEKPSDTGGAGDKFSPDVEIRIERRKIVSAIHSCSKNAAGDKGSFEVSDRKDQSSLLGLRFGKTNDNVARTTAEEGERGSLRSRVGESDGTALQGQGDESSWMKDMDQPNKSNALQKQPPEMDSFHERTCVTNDHKKTLSTRGIVVMKDNKSKGEFMSDNSKEDLSLLRLAGFGGGINTSKKSTRGVSVEGKRVQALVETINKPLDDMDKLQQQQSILRAQVQSRLARHRNSTKPKQTNHVVNFEEWASQTEKKATQTNLEAPLVQNLKELEEGFHEIGKDNKVLSIALKLLSERLDKSEKLKAQLIEQNAQLCARLQEANNRNEQLLLQQAETSQQLADLKLTLDPESRKSNKPSVNSVNPERHVARTVDLETWLSEAPKAFENLNKASKDINSGDIMADLKSDVVKETKESLAARIDEEMNEIVALQAQLREEHKFLKVKQQLAQPKTERLVSALKVGETAKIQTEEGKDEAVHDAKPDFETKEKLHRKTRTQDMLTSDMRYDLKFGEYPYRGPSRSGEVDDEELAWLQKAFGEYKEDT